jgi:DNA-binding response OmpR family regulator
MAAGGGDELVERLRRRCPRLPVLLISGYGSSGEHVLAKPFGVSELAARVLDLLAA